jgi:DNA modification methylase
MTVRILHGDCREVLKSLPDQSVHCVVTSPPYWGLRDYGVAGQIGLEPNYQDYVVTLVAVFREVQRVLRDDGTLWLNMGDCYYSGDRGDYRNDAHRWENSELQCGNRGNADTVRPNRLPQNGLKSKDLVGIPWRVAFALQADGWYLRQDIIWSKPNPMPESVTDRCTKAHEYIFLLSKREQYYYDQQAIAETAKWADDNRADSGRLTYNGKRQGIAGTGNEAFVKITDTRNKRSVWEVATAPFSEAHFATFPPALIEPCILAGCPKDGTVLDPFGGAGTTGLVADRLQRNAILIELNPNYADMTERRLMDDAGMFAAIETIDNSSKAEA